MSFCDSFNASFSVWLIPVRGWMVCIVSHSEYSQHEDDESSPECDCWDDKSEWLECMYAYAYVYVCIICIHCTHIPRLTAVKIRVLNYYRRDALVTSLTDQVLSRDDKDFFRRTYICTYNVIRMYVSWP